MSLANRILQEKRAILLPLGAALALNVAIYGLAVYPLMGKVAAAEARASAATANLRTSEQMFQQARATLVGKEKADQELQRFYHDVLPADLTGARRITYLRLPQIAQRANLKYERRTITTERIEDSHLGKLHMSMVLQGSYADVRKFIYELEKAQEFVVIEDVALVQGEERSAPLILTLQLSTYYLTGEDGI